MSKGEVHVGVRERDHIIALLIPEGEAVNDLGEFLTVGPDVLNRSRAHRARNPRHRLHSAESVDHSPRNEVVPRVSGLNEHERVLGPLALDLNTLRENSDYGALILGIGCQEV